MANTTEKTEEKEGTLSQIKGVLDPISGLLEGVGQKINDSKWWELLIYGAASGWGLSQVLDKLGDLLKQDDGKRMVARNLQRKVFYELLKKNGGEAWAAICKAYNHLKGLGFDDTDIQRILCDLDAWRSRSTVRRDNARALRRRTTWIGIPALVLLVFCATTKQTIVPTVLLIAGIAAVICLGIYVIVILVSRANRRADQLMAAPTQQPAE